MSVILLISIRFYGLSTGQILIRHLDDTMLDALRRRAVRAAAHARYAGAVRLLWPRARYCSERAMWLR
jgi:hypothetical protein